MTLASSPPPPHPPSSQARSWGAGWSAYLRLARFDKPVGTLLLLWPTAWALWLAAQGFPDPPRLLVFLLGVVLMRAAGCVLNDLADRRFDGAVKRTAHRVLAQGELSVRAAAGFAVALLLLSAALLFFLNPLAIGVALLAVLTAAAYPFFKRFFPVPQAVLGVAFGFGIPMAFADTLNTLPVLAWLLWIANALWVLAYDTAYAMVDRDDDLQLSLKSSAIAFGDWDWAAVACAQMGFLLLMLTLPLMAPLGGIYLISWLAAVLLSWMLLKRLRSRSREDAFWVFRQSHWVGAILWVGMAMDLALQALF
ncbi:MAG: 4-hydroxybenzoate octaprenyltransferase [Burkholderiaceae bacterium]